MRFFATILLLLFLRGPAFGAIALDQQTVTDIFDASAGTSTLSSFASLPAAGAAVVVTWFAWRGGGYEVTSVTDNQSNSYTAVCTPITNINSVACLAWALNVASTGTFTITINNTNAGSENYIVARASSFTGILTAGAIDQTGIGEDAGPQAADASVTSAGVTTQADELVVVCAAITEIGNSNMTIGTATTGYTQIVVEQNFNLHATGACDYKIVAATGSQSANWSHDDITGSTSSDGWATIMRTFKAAVTAGSRRKPYYILQ